MIPVLIIGYGNPLRSDDGIGWHTARALIGHWPADQVRVETSHQLLPEMADWLSEAEYVFFVDASWDTRPGVIRARPVSAQEGKKSTMTHQFTPQGLLADAASLYQKTPKAVLVTLGAESFEHGESLSPSLAAIFPQFLERIKVLVQQKLAIAAPERESAYA